MLDQSGPVGTFIIRSSDKTYAALSVVGPNGVIHTHIEKTDRGLSCTACAHFCRSHSTLFIADRPSDQKDVNVLP